MGGMIAYEMACQLKQKGENVPMLFLIDSYAPHACLRVGNKETGDFIAFIQTLGGAFDVDLLEFFCKTNGILTDNIDKNIKTLSSLLGRISVSDRLNMLHECIHNSKMPGFEQNRLDRMYRVFSSNYRSIFNYVPGTYSGQVLFLRATQFQDVQEDKSLFGPGNAWQSLGWSQYANDIKSYDIPGSRHFTILTPPFVNIAAEKINLCLSQPHIQEIKK